jgi:hypothetical protein
MTADVVAVAMEAHWTDFCSFTTFTAEGTMTSGFC